MHSLRVPQTVKHRVTYDPAIPLRICPREIKTYVHTQTFPPMFIAALFIRAKSRNNPNVHKLMNTLINCGICM